MGAGASASLLDGELGRGGSVWLCAPACPTPGAQDPAASLQARRAGEHECLQTTFSLGCVFTPIALFGQLFAAVDAVDLATVEQLVAAGAEINETDSDMGWSVLHHAINIPDEQSRVHMCVLTRLALASPHPEQALCLPAG